MKKFVPSSKEKDLIIKLELLTKFGYSQLVDHLKVPQTQDSIKDLYHATLFQYIGIAHHLTVGITKIAKSGLPEVGLILLRTLIELSINVMYIQFDKTGRRSRAFYLDAEKSKRKIIKEWLEFVKRHPEYQSKLKDTKTGLESKLIKKDKDIKKLENLYGKLRFPSIKERAIAIDKSRGLPDNEFMYIAVYKYFCDFTHMSASGFNVLLEKSESATRFLLDPHHKGLDMLIISTYGLYLGFISFLNEYFDISAKKELDKFDAMFKEFLETSNKVVK